MDNNIWEGCNVCGADHETECCPELGLMPSGIENSSVTRARLTMPSSVYAVDLPGQEVAVVAQNIIQKKTQFGPFEAKKTTHEFNDDSLFILKVLVRDSTVISLDTTNENECNWLCLIRAATSSSEQNMIAYQLGTSIFYNTISDIQAGEELKVWYAPQYARKVGKMVTPDGVSRVMLNMQVIYPSVEELSESLFVETAVETQPGETQSGDTTEQIIQTVQLEEPQVPEEVINRDAQQQVEDCTMESEAAQVSSVPNAVEKMKQRCKRCNKTYDSENDLAHHLMSHLAAKKETRSRGRPRKNAGHELQSGIANTRHLFKTGKDSEEHNGHVIDKKQTENEEEDTSSDPEFKLKWSYKSSNTPKDLDIKVYEIVRGERIQPKRTYKGKRRYNEDFIYSNDAKSTLHDHDEDKEVSDTAKSDSVNQIKTPAKENVQSQTEPPIKRGRGRPRKRKLSEEEKETESVAKSQKILTTNTSNETSVNEVSDNTVQAQVIPLNKNTEGVKLEIVNYIQEVQNDSETFTSQLSSEETLVLLQTDDGGETYQILNENVRLGSHKIIQNGELNSDEVSVQIIEKNQEEPKLNQSNQVIQNVQVTHLNQPNQSMKEIQEDITLKQPTQNEEKIHGDVKLIHLNESEQMNQEDIVLNQVCVSNDNEMKQINESKERSSHLSNNHEDETLEKHRDIDESKVESLLSNNDADQVTGKTKVMEKSSLPLNNDADETTENNGIVSYTSEGTEQITREVNASPINEEISGNQTKNLEANNEEGNKDGQTENSESKEEEEEEDSQMKKTKQTATKAIDTQEIQKELLRIEGLEQDYEEIQEVKHKNSKYKYVCKHCGKHFNSKHYLKLHMPRHTGKFSCSHCGFYYARKENLLKHECKMKLVLPLVEVDGKKIYKCQQCDLEIEDIDKAREHYKIHKKEAKCIDCGQVFHRYQLLRDHICPNAKNELVECDICKQTFPSENSLFRHMAMHTDIFKCSTCFKTFARKDSLLKHVLICCPEKAEEYKVYACKKCRKGFSTKLGVDNHEAMCDQEICGKCNKVFDSVEALQKHETNCTISKTPREEKVTFSCTECGKSFRNLSYLNRHKLMHNSKLDCMVCKKVFKTNEEKVYHERFCMAHTAICELGSTKCDLCDEEFKSAKLYREHYFIHTHPYSCDKCHKRFIKIGTLHTHNCVLDTNPVTCPHCDKTFNGNKSLKSHIRREHRKDYTCRICSNRYTTAEEFEKHICIGEDGEPEPFNIEKEEVLFSGKPICHVCGKEFASTSNLNKHMKTHGEKNIECNICFKKFHHEEYLKVHIEGVHEKRHKFQCSHCGKVLTSKPGLTSHTKQFHTDQREVYPCSECGKVFSQKGNRKMHMYSHVRERMFKCDQCTRTFKYPEQLKKHKLIHSATEETQCEICEKIFARTTDLQKHVATVHSGLMYVCHICNSRCSHKQTLLRHYKRKHPEAAHVTKNDEFVESLFQKVEETPSPQTNPIITYISQDVSVPFETVAIETGNIHVPQSAAEVLKSLSGSNVAADGQILTSAAMQNFNTGEIVDGATIINLPTMNLNQEVETVDGQQTVVILQIMNPSGEQDVEEIEVIENVVDL